MTHSLRSTGITQLPHYYGAVCPWLEPRYFQPRGYVHLCLFSSHLNTRFACFALAPTSSSCRLYTGCRLSSKQVPPRLIPRTSNLRGFDSNSIHHDASPAVSLRSSP